MRSQVKESVMGKKFPGNVDPVECEAVKQNNCHSPLMLNKVVS